MEPGVGVKFVSPRAQIAGHAPRAVPWLPVGRQQRAAAEGAVQHATHGEHAGGTGGAGGASAANGAIGASGTSGRGSTEPR